ncbi:MAG: hypothetical protein ACRCX8_18980 [Sarcina sp.]
MDKKIKNLASEIKEDILTENGINVLTVEERAEVSKGVSKNLIVDIFDAYVYNAQGECIMFSENLTESGITGSADQEEVRNGKGNEIFAIINKNKNLEVTLTENVFDFKSLAYKNGTQVVSGEGVGSVGTQELIASGASSSVKVTLAKAPLHPAKVVCTKDGVVVSGTVSGSDVTFSTGVTAGDKIVVEPYMTALTSVEKIVIKADEFPTANTLILQTIELDKGMNHVADIFIVIDRATPNGAWEINPGSERQATNSAYTFKVAANSSGELATIYRKTV